MRKKKRAGTSRPKALRVTGSRAQPFPVVGIGASAGGLEAIMQMLKTLPSSTGMAFVLVQHLDPTHASALTSLLSKLTEMPVSEAKNGTPLRPNQIYIIPPNKLLYISQRRLKLYPRKDSESNLPVDEFLCSLAEEEGNRAVGIVLSGNGSDGTRGLLAIKSAGGITFAQEETTAKYAAMPGSAITAGCVDFVLAPDQIARELSRIAGHPYVTPTVTPADREAEPAHENPAFIEILAILRQRTTVDFKHYKHATLQRRLQRRMMLHKFESLKEYSAFLHAHPEEVNELFSDILIHVTSFFRDPAVFTTLKRKVFPRMLRNKARDQTLRIWVPGCSTGEEVYSLAIALTEFMMERKIHQTAQVFGTDINDTALEKARAGVYPDSLRRDIGADRLRRFFARTDAGYRINKSIREICIFARQNLVVDPPFSNLDLISCRNVLIYLNATIQRKIMPVFHYALNPTGFLMLGSAESIGGFSEIFALHDKKAKIYTKKSAHLRPMATFGRAAAHMRESPRNIERRAPEPFEPNLGDIQKHADRLLLSHYCPAGVVINRLMEVLQFRGRTAQFLEHAQGEASLSLLKMAREGLLVDLRTAVTRAIKQDTRVICPGPRIRINGHSVRVRIEVIPYSVPPSRERFYLVLFQMSDATPASRDKALRPPGNVPKERRHTARLEAELAATRESLQAIIEEQEATMEELRSASEETMSSNEELQSTNEELETAKEELQSTNEELTTLNDELESRNTQLEHVNNDLHNVLASVTTPIFILGTDLRIRRFNAVAGKLLNLIPGDVGRPITDINLPLEVPDLPKLVLDVIDNLAAREIEVRGRDGHWWLVQARPYKTTDNKIDGAVVAMVDIDLFKTNSEQSNHGRAFADAVLEAVQRPALLLQSDLTVQAANQRFYKDFDLTPKQTLRQRVYSLGDGQWDIPKLRTLLEETLPHNSNLQNFDLEHNFPKLGPMRMKIDASRLALDGDKQLVLLVINHAEAEVR